MIFQHFTKSFDFLKGKSICICYGDTYVYSDQESPLDTFSLPLLPAPLVVFGATEPPSSSAFILEMTSVKDTSPEDRRRDR